MHQLLTSHLQLSQEGEIMRKLLGLICIAALTATGCQTISKSDKVVNSPTPKPTSQNALASYNPIAKLTGNSLPKGRPDSIVAIWKDATYTVAGERPTRGFGGRLYFYDRNKNPVVVDGELVVYGFVDDKFNPKQAPEKRFVFTRDQLPDHMSVSSVGPSYNIWLPWDHINGEQKQVTIIATFKEAGTGRLCQSEAIPSILPGTKPVIEEATQDIIEEIREKEAIRTNTKRVGFEDTKPDGTKKIKTHEIKVPAGSKERLFGSVPTATYRLPQPKVTQPSAVAQASATEEISTADSQPSAGSSPDQRPAQSGQFVRQGRLPPGSQPPRLGAKSSPEVRR